MDVRITERKLKSTHGYIELIQFLQLEGVNPKMTINNGAITMHIQSDVKIPKYMLSFQLPGRGKTQENLAVADWQAPLDDEEFNENNAVEPLAPLI